MWELFIQLAILAVGTLNRALWVIFILVILSIGATLCLLFGIANNTRALVAVWILSSFVQLVLIVCVTILFDPILTSVFKLHTEDYERETYDAKIKKQKLFAITCAIILIKVLSLVAVLRNEKKLKNKTAHSIAYSNTISNNFSESDYTPSKPPSYEDACADNPRHRSQSMNIVIQSLPRTFP